MINHLSSSCTETRLIPTVLIVKVICPSLTFCQCDPWCVKHNPFIPFSGLNVGSITNASLRSSLFHNICCQRTSMIRLYNREYTIWLIFSHSPQYFHLSLSEKGFIDCDTRVSRAVCQLRCSWFDPRSSLKLFCDLNWGWSSCQHLNEPSLLGHPKKVYQ